MIASDSEDIQFNDELDTIQLADEGIELSTRNALRAILLLIISEIKEVRAKVGGADWHSNEQLARLEAYIIKEFS